MSQYQAQHSDTYENTAIVYDIKIYQNWYCFERWVIFQFLFYADLSNYKIEEQQQHQSFPDESTTEATGSTEIGKNLIVEDDLKSAYVVDSAVCWLTCDLFLF